MSTTATHYLCIGNPPHTPPCGVSGTYEQHASGGAAEAHTKATTHGTISSLWPISDGMRARLGVAA